MTNKTTNKLEGYMCCTSHSMTYYLPTSRAAGMKVPTNFYSPLRAHICAPKMVTTLLISKVPYILSELTQPTATIPTIWGEGSQVWTFCTNKCFFACLSLYDVFVPIFVYYSIAFFYDCLTYFQSRPQKSTALRPPGRLWWEQATV